jgi:hypothetical protein
MSREDSRIVSHFEQLMAREREKRSERGLGKSVQLTSEGGGTCEGSRCLSLLPNPFNYTYILL